MRTWRREHSDGTTAMVIEQISGHFLAILAAPLRSRVAGEAFTTLEDAQRSADGLISSPPERHICGKTCTIWREA